MSIKKTPKMHQKIENFLTNTRFITKTWKIMHTKYFIQLKEKGDQTQMKIQSDPLPPTGNMIKRKGT